MVAMVYCLDEFNKENVSFQIKRDDLTSNYFESGR